MVVGVILISIIHLFSLLKTGGNNYDGGHKEPHEHKGNEHFTKAQSSNVEGLVSFGRSNNNRETESIPQGSSSNLNLVGTNSPPKEAANPKMIEERHSQLSSVSAPSEERKHLLAARKCEAETQTREIAESQASLSTPPDSSSVRASNIDTVLNICRCVAIYNL